MANPNRTVAEFRRKNPRARSGVAPDSELQEIFDAVSRGELTSKDGAEKLKKLLELRDTQSQTK